MILSKISFSFESIFFLVSTYTRMHHCTCNYVPYGMHIRFAFSWEEEKIPPNWALSIGCPISLVVSPLWSPVYWKRKKGKGSRCIWIRVNSGMSKKKAIGILGIIKPSLQVSIDCEMVRSWNQPSLLLLNNRPMFFPFQCEPIQFATHPIQCIEHAPTIDKKGVCLLDRHLDPTKLLSAKIVPRSSCYGVSYPSSLARSASSDVFSFLSTREKRKGGTIYFFSLVCRWRHRLTLSPSLSICSLFLVALFHFTLFSLCPLTLTHCHGHTLTHMSGCTL